MIQYCAHCGVMIMPGDSVEYKDGNIYIQGHAS